MMFPIIKVSFFLLFCLTSSVSAKLSSSFYDKTCPLALTTIKTEITLAVTKELRMGASLLRLHFHDCFVQNGYKVDFSTPKQLYKIVDNVYKDQGCDASILLDDTSSFTGEQTAFPNVNTIRGLEVIDNIKSTVESLCPNVVSCADILTVAARDSVVALGGPSWTVQLGRRDSTTASLNLANSDLPSPSSSLNDLITSFSNKGFTTKEMVALSGSHTIGKSTCRNFRGRIYNDNNIDSSFAQSLQENCPTSGDDGNLSPLDTTSPTTFDNAYFKNLQIKKGLLHSDQELFNNGSTDSQVNSYVTDPASFRADFANAMVKMGNLSPLTGSNGQIRTLCGKIN